MWFLPRSSFHGARGAAPSGAAQEATAPADRRTDLSADAGLGTVWNSGDLFVPFSF